MAKKKRPTRRQPVKINEVTDPNTIRSADKRYYASGQSSVIPRTIADSTLKKPHQLKPIPTPPAVAPGGGGHEGNTIISADKYYKSHEAPAQTVTVARQTAEAPESAAHGVGPLVISRAADIDNVMSRAVEMVAAGYSPVRVAIGNKGLIPHIRQKIEFAVTRETISEDQGRDIQLGLTPEAAGYTEVEDAVRGVELGGGEKLAEDLTGPPSTEELAEVPEAGEIDPSGADLGDPAAFVFGGDEDEEEEIEEDEEPEEVVADDEPGDPLDDPEQFVVDDEEEDEEEELDDFMSEEEENDPETGAGAR